VNLTRGGVRAQQERIVATAFGLQEVGVLHIARRMPDGEVEQLEVVLVGFHLARAVNLKAHLAENLIEFAQDLGIGMQAAADDGPSRQRDIQPFLAESALQSRLPQRLGAGGKRRLEGFFNFVGLLPYRRALLLGKRAEAAENLHEGRGAPQMGNSPLLKGSLVLHLR